MKLTNGYTNFENPDEEFEFKKRLDNMLKKFFKLQWEDLPEILRKLGFKGSEYELSDFDYNINGKISFFIRTKSKLATVEFSVGNMVNPNSKVKVIKENKSEEVYYISRVIEVQRENEIMEELNKLSKRDKRKGRKLLRKLMKD